MMSRLSRPVSLLVLTAWLTVACFGVAHAADGELDSTFGGDGKVTTVFENGARARAVAVQADGRIVVVGAAAGPSVSGEFALARYEDDGDLDATFGVGGTLTTPITPMGGDEAYAVAVQADGKIVAAGTANQELFALARYEPDGTLDPTFGTGGIVATDITPGKRDIAYSVAIQSDGKIVTAGTTGTNRPKFALARYDIDGALDTSFGEDGTVITGFGGWGIAGEMLIQPNGKILLAGHGGRGFGLARYLPDGTLDPSFGGDGKVTAVPLGWAMALALQPDGRIVVAGDRDIFVSAVVRFTRHGELDRTFGGDGKVLTDIGGVEQALIGLVIQPNSRIVGAGHAGPHEYGEAVEWRFVLTRLRADGTLDRTFGRHGKVSTRFAGGAFAIDATAQPDGKVVVVGGAGASNTEAFAVARYLV